MNVRIIKNVNLKIIDYSLGFCGSQYDFHFFNYTCFTIH